MTATSTSLLKAVPAYSPRPKKVHRICLLFSDDANVVRTRYVRRYAGRARHSDIDSDTEPSNSDEDAAAGDAARRRDSASSDASSRGWLSWCSIV